MDTHFVDSIIESLKIPREVLIEFIVGFSRFEYALKAAGFIKDPQGPAEVSWDKFENWLDTLPPAEVTPVLDRGQYLLKYPTKKLVLRNGVPYWEVPGRDGQSDIRFLVEGLRRARNNLFHGGKWLTAPEPPDRNKRVISTGVSVLFALITLPSAKELSRHFREIP